MGQLQTIDRNLDIIQGLHLGEFSVVNLVDDDGTLLISKQALDHRFNGGLEDEWEILHDLRDEKKTADSIDVLLNLIENNGKPERPEASQYHPFLPEPVSFTETPDGKRVNLYTYVPNLYSLAQIKNIYPMGIDVKDMAWIFRRLLTIVGYIYRCDASHGHINSQHVLIEPDNHGLVLVDWAGTMTADKIKIDLACAASQMRLITDLTDDSTSPIRAFLRSCDSDEDPWKILSEFDTLIERLWGPRRFHKFEMPTTTKTGGIVEK